MFIFVFFFELFPKLSDFINLDDCIGKIYQNRSSFLKKYLKSLKNRFFLVKKLKIQVIIFIIMLIRFSEKIFNQIRYTA